MLFMIFSWTMRPLARGEWLARMVGTCNHCKANTSQILRDIPTSLYAIFNTFNTASPVPKMKFVLIELQRFTVFIHRPLPDQEHANY